MTIFPWIFLGLIAGYLASRTVSKPGDAVILVIAGAVYGGFFFTWMGAAGVDRVPSQQDVRGKWSSCSPSWWSARRWSSGDHLIAATSEQAHGQQARLFAGSAS